LLFNFVMHCIISIVVVAFEINYLSYSASCPAGNSGPTASHTDRPLAIKIYSINI